MSEAEKIQFRPEGEPAFPLDEETVEEKENSSEEKTTTESTPSSEEDKDQTLNSKESDGSIDEHPRWKEREDDWKNRFNDQEKRHVDEINKLRDEFLENGRKGNDNPDTTSEEIPAWFGGDEEQWKQFQQWDSVRIEKVKEEAVKTITAKSEAEQKLIDDATKYFNDTVATIESDKDLNPSGERIDRNKLMKFVLEYDNGKGLVDVHGRWNYRAGWQMIKSTQPERPQSNNIDEKKKVAAATSSENRSEPKSSNVMTTKDFQNPMNRPW